MCTCPILIPTPIPIPIPILSSGFSSRSSCHALPPPPPATTRRTARQLGSVKRWPLQFALLSCGMQHVLFHVLSIHDSLAENLAAGLNLTLATLATQSRNTMAQHLTKQSQTTALSAKTQHSFFYTHTHTHTY